MIENLLTKETIKTDVECLTWQDCVKECGNLLLSQNKVEPNFIKSMEETVMEFGPYMILIPKVAFFHGMPGNDVHEICLSLITLKDSVYFKEFENQEIKCAFGFGAVDSDSHLKMLQEVSELFRNSEFVNLITNNGEKEKILEQVLMLEEKK